MLSLDGNKFFNESFCKKYNIFSNCEKKNIIYYVDCKKLKYSTSRVKM